MKTAKKGMAGWTIIMQLENNSNEVAITCDLGVDNPLEVYGVSLGTEYEVDKKELEKSIEKNKAIIARARESRKRYLQKV